jgi:hypothetical protein
MIKRTFHPGLSTEKTPLMLQGHIRYITDNPYRLLALPSSTAQRQLRNEAAQAEKARKVGLASPAGLAEAFGEAELDRVAEIALAIAADPIRRTVYRLFWPFQPVDVARTGHGPADWTFTARDPSGEPAYCRKQRLFLENWFKCAATGGTTYLQASITHLTELYTDEDCDEYLVGLLAMDGDESADNLGNVGAAFNEAVVATLSMALRHGLSIDVAPQDACDILRNATSTGLPAELVEKAVYAELVPVGNEEAASVQRATQSLLASIDANGWPAAQAEFDPTRANRLHWLGTIASGLHPSSSDWTLAAVTYDEALAREMRAVALALALEQDDLGGAVTLLSDALRYRIGSEFRSLLEDDLRQLCGAVLTSEQAAQFKAAWAAAKPVASTPTMFTLNGFGTRLYGWSRFPGREGWRYATLYFTVLFIPICPIKRYVVSDAPSGGYYFHAAAPFTNAHKIHLWTGLALIAWFFLSITLFSNSPTPRSTTEAEPSHSGSYAAQAVADSESTTSESGITLLKEEIERDEADLDKLRKDLTREGNSLISMKANIARKRTKLDHADKAIVDQFNAIVDEYNNSSDKFQKATKEFNASVERYNAKLKRLREIRAARK